MLEIYNTKDKLPNHREWVLIFESHSQSVHETEDGYWTVAQFVSGGITEEEREELRKQNDPRAKIIFSADVHGNNLAPYKWNGHGPFSYFGQAIRFWTYLPTKKLHEQYTNEEIYGYNPFKVDS